MLFVKQKNGVSTFGSTAAVLLRVRSNSNSTAGVLQHAVPLFLLLPLLLLLLWLPPPLTINTANGILGGTVCSTGAFLRLAHKLSAHQNLIPGIGLVDCTLQYSRQLVRGTLQY